MGIFFDYNQIRQSKHIWDRDGKSASDLNEIIQPCIGCSITLESPTDMQNDKRNTRRKLLKDIFWYDKCLCKLFFADDVEHMLQDCILKLEQAEFNAAKLESLVNMSSNNPLDSQQLLSIQKKVMYLHWAYKIALADMPCGDSWTACCEQAISSFGDINVFYVKNECTLCHWSSYFLQKSCFPHPNIYVELGKENQPKLFAYFPEAREKLDKWANNNLVNLSCERAADYIREELISELYNIYKEENNPLDGCEIQSLHDFLAFLNIPTIDPSTAWRWLQNLGFAFHSLRKSYYNDRHENIENKKARRCFISKYFQLELYAHCWVQVPLDEARALEEESDENKPQLMRNTWAFEFEQTGQTFREYHVDCHPVFAKYVSSQNKCWGGNLSCHFPIGAWPVILIGKDESVFKENHFSSRVWHGSEGQSMLQPKDEGHGWMVSAYVSRAWSFLVSDMLTEEKLNLINEQQRQPLYHEYISKDAAQEVKGSTEKGDITDPSPFCHFFEYGMD